MKHDDVLGLLPRVAAHPIEEVFGWLKRGLSSLEVGGRTVAVRSVVAQQLIFASGDGGVSNVCPGGSAMLHQKNRRLAKLRLKTVKKWGVLSITIDISTVVVTPLVEYQRC
jgi:hypothetical protein